MIYITILKRVIQKRYLLHRWLGGGRVGKGEVIFLQFCDIENLENFFQEIENLYLFSYIKGGKKKTHSFF
jgi:hypothetical protein